MTSLTVPASPFPALFVNMAVPRKKRDPPDDLECLVFLFISFFYFLFGGGALEFLRHSQKWDFCRGSKISTVYIHPYIIISLYIHIYNHIYIHAQKEPLFSQV